jgi:hypothetical protein
MRTLVLLPVLALAALELSGCRTSNPTSGGSGSAINDTFVIPALLDVEDAWPLAQETVRGISTSGYAVQDYPRVVRGTFSGAQVIVTVEAYDVNQSKIIIEAHTGPLSDPHAAEMVSNRLIEAIFKRDRARP